MIINPQRMRRGLATILIMFVCLSVCHLQDLGDSIVLTLKTSINAKQIMFHSSLKKRFSV